MRTRTGHPSCPPALLLNESCVQGAQSQKKAELSPHSPAPLLPPLFIRALFKHMAAADVPERTFCSPPASRLKHLGSDMTSGGGYFLFPFLNFPFIWFAYKANNEVLKTIHNQYTITLIGSLTCNF